MMDVVWQVTDIIMVVISKEAHTMGLGAYIPLMGLGPNRAELQ